MKNVLILFVLAFLVSCKSPKTTTQTETPQNQVTTDFITGKVNEVMPGKDGYTARITTANNLVYLVTISRANLKDAAQYKSVVTGDTVSIKGDLWKMENENHITVREMK